MRSIPWQNPQFRHFCEPVSVANSWQKFFGQFGGKIWPLRKKLWPAEFPRKAEKCSNPSTALLHLHVSNTDYEWQEFSLVFFNTLVSFWSNFIKMQFNKRWLMFSSTEEFYGASGPIILKSVHNTGRRANKCRQIFPKAYFKGKSTNALVSIFLLIHTLRCYK